MGSSGIIRTPAIVVRRTNYGEADRIIQVITPQHGKLSVMARGIRRSGSKFAGSLELFSITDVTLRPGKGDLVMVTSARVEQFYGSILTDYDRLQAGYRYLRGVGRAAEMISEPEWYDVIDVALRSLNQLDIPLPLIEVWYRLQVAQLLGQGMNLSTDIIGDALRSGSRYQFDSDTMSFEPKENGPYGPDEIKLLRVAQANPPQVLARINFTDDILQRIHAITHMTAEP